MMGIDSCISCINPLSDHTSKILICIPYTYGARVICVRVCVYVCVCVDKVEVKCCRQ